MVAMPRAERKRSKTNIYHILLRGINKQRIFEEEADYLYFLTCLSEVKEISKFTLYAYCLMGNHIHLLIKEGDEPLSNAFKRIGARYVFWFNWKYGRNGHLFQDRFRSEPVESDEYFKTVLSYIYQNPVKAGICKKPKDYKWSSRNLSNNNKMIDEQDLYEIVSVEMAEELENKEIRGEILEPQIGRRQNISDETAFELMKSIGDIKSATEYQALNRELQMKVFSKMREQGVSIRQFARLSGLGKGVCERMSREMQDA
jgi:REP element-mobilizing transposase RayT